MDPRHVRLVLGVAILIVMTLAGVLFGWWAGQQLPGAEPGVSVEGGAEAVPGPE